MLNPDASESPRAIFVRGEICHWKVKADQIGRLLDHATETLGEAIPYDDKTSVGIDLVDCIIDGAAALTRDLARLLNTMEDLLIEEEKRARQA